MSTALDSGEVSEGDSWQCGVAIQGPDSVSDNAVLLLRKQGLTVDRGAELPVSGTQWVQGLGDVEHSWIDTHIFSSH